MWGGVTNLSARCRTQRMDWPIYAILECDPWGPWGWWW